MEAKLGCPGVGFCYPLPAPGESLEDLTHV